MKNITKKIVLFSLIINLFCFGVFANRKDRIYRLGVELDKLANYIAQSSYEHFKEWDEEITNEEQAVLFKSGEFASSCSLFLKLLSESSEYYRRGFIRTNLYNAFLYITRSFKDLEYEMMKLKIATYSMDECKEVLKRMDYEFSRWPSTGNISYLSDRYVKSSENTVYLIEKQGTGNYIKRPFANLESLYRYNYINKKKKNPWKYLKDVSEELLESIPEGTKISLNFEKCLVMEQSSKQNKPVYLVQKGKKHPIPSPEILKRFGGWDNVYELPSEIIERYPLGKPIK